LNECVKPCFLSIVVLNILENISLIKYMFCSLLLIVFSIKKIVAKNDIILTKTEYCDTLDDTSMT